MAGYKQREKSCCEYSFVQHALYVGIKQARLVHLRHDDLLIKKESFLFLEMPYTCLNSSILCTLLFPSLLDFVDLQQIFVDTLQNIKRRG